MKVHNLTKLIWDNAPSVITAKSPLRYAGKVIAIDASTYLNYIVSSAKADRDLNNNEEEQPSADTRYLYERLISIRTDR